MKRLLVIAVLLLAWAPAWAGMLIDGVAAGGSASATVLDVKFEGASEAARLKNLVDDSGPTATGYQTTSSDKYAGTYSYDTNGSSTGLVYSISDFDPTDYEIAFAWKMPSYTQGDFIFYIRVDAANYIYVFTSTDSLLVQHKAGGVAESLSSTTTINDGAWHTISLIADSGTVYLYIDGSQTPDDSEAIGGTWSGSVTECLWGVEYDYTSTCDCYLDNLYISGAP